MKSRIFTAFLSRFRKKTLLLMVLISFSCARAGDVLQIMPTGDSLTSEPVLMEIEKGLEEAGFDDYEFVGPVSVPATPKNLNKQAYGGMQLKDILNGRMVKGEMQMGLVQSIPQFHPDVILLMGGTNDIGSDNVKATKDAYTHLLDYLAEAAPAATVLVSPIPKVHSQKQYAHLLGRIDELNSYIAEEVQRLAAKGLKIIMVDASKFPLEDEDIGDDGLHFLESGKVKIGKRWVDALVTGGVIPSATAKK